jgi:serine/threonine protein kinase
MAAHGLTKCRDQHLRCNAGWDRVPEECSQDIADLIDRCLSANAASRPTALELMTILSSHLAIADDGLSLPEDNEDGPGSSEESFEVHFEREGECLSSLSECQSAPKVSL